MAETPLFVGNLRGLLKNGIKTKSVEIGRFWYMKMQNVYPQNRGGKHGVKICKTFNFKMKEK